MCNFVPGQAIALAKISSLYELGENLPGTLGPVVPLVGEIGDVNRESELTKYATVVLKTDPGLEVHAVSQLSARLAGPIQQGEAIVDLNHILPWSAPDLPGEPSTRLGAHAEREAAALRGLLRRVFPEGESARVAVLDSGLAADFVPHRELRYLDYSAGGRLTADTARVDLNGHGTRVISILDEVLPANVQLTVGRLPSNEGELTALTIAQALADLIARELPDVVNLSVSLRTDTLICPHCKHRVRGATFFSTMLPLIIRLGGRSSTSTVTVMAIGNTGQYQNSRWLTDDMQTLLFAVAGNKKGDRARYSNSPAGPRADLYSAMAFGGDDIDEPGAEGVFADGARGTSFAAPFVTAAALWAKRDLDTSRAAARDAIGERTQRFIEAARHGGGARKLLLAELGALWLQGQREEREKGG
jgi:hypothetical protein